MSIEKDFEAIFESDEPKPNFTQKDTIMVNRDNAIVSEVFVKLNARKYSYYFVRLNFGKPFCFVFPREEKLFEKLEARFTQKGYADYFALLEKNVSKMNMLKLNPTIMNHLGVKPNGLLEFEGKGSYFILRKAKE